jgi:hypothetical protein
MSTALKQKQHDWNARLRAFNSEHAGMSTRLAVFEPRDGAVNDYWLENGLPLNEVSFEEHGGRMTAEILLDGFTHVVANADRVELIYGRDGSDSGLNVVDTDGRTTVLRFE